MCKVSSELAYFTTVLDTIYVGTTSEVYAGQYVAVFHLPSSRSIYDFIYAAICSSMFCNSLCILVVLERLIIKIVFNLDSSKSGILYTTGRMAVQRMQIVVVVQNNYLVPLHRSQW